MKKTQPLTLPLFIIFTSALIIRCLYLMLMRDHYFFYNHPSSDINYYLSWAWQIAKGDWIGHKVFSGLPLYPYLLAVFLRLSIGIIPVVKLFHIAIGSLNCLLVFLLTKKLFSDKIAIIATILMLTNFTLIYYDSLLMPVSIIITLTLLILFTLQDEYNLATKRGKIIFGILLGITSLADGKFLIFTALFLGSIIFKKIPIKEKQSLIIFILIGFMSILTLTGLRNKLISKEWVWITAQSGLSFYVGNNPLSTGTYINPDFIRPTHAGQDEDQILEAQCRTGTLMGAKQASRYWQNEGFKFIREHPIRYLKLLSKKMHLFYIESENAYDIDLIFQRHWKKIFDFNSITILMPLALLGIFISFRHKKLNTETILLILSQWIFTCIFFLNHRHRATIMPILIIYEAVAILWLFKQIKAKQYKLIGKIFAGLIAWFIIFHSQKINAQDYAFLKHSKAGPIFVEDLQIERGKQEYFAALKIKPLDTTTLYNLATAYALEENYSKAIHYYNRVLGINPIQIDSLFNLGYCSEQLEQLDQAKDYYFKVLRLNSDSADAHLRLTKIYTREQNCRLAKLHYYQIISLNPELKKEIEFQIELFCPEIP